jgi:hypothetical protein
MLFCIPLCLLTVNWLVADNMPSTVKDFEIPLFLSGIELPLIGKYLVHAWVDNSLVTEKAGKLDNVGDPMHLWDQQIVHVLDVLIRVIKNDLRKLLFRRHCGGLMRSLCFPEPLPWAGLGFAAHGKKTGVEEDRGSD